jgi:hypothetical protein
MRSVARSDEFDRYEEKKGGDTGRNVFPTDVDSIPVFSVVEVMISPANHNGFEQGYGLQVYFFPPESYVTCVDSLPRTAGGAHSPVRILVVLHDGGSGTGIASIVV